MWVSPSFPFPQTHIFSTVFEDVRTTQFDDSGIGSENSTLISNRGNSDIVSPPSVSMCHPLTIRRSSILPLQAQLPIPMLISTGIGIQKKRSPSVILLKNPLQTTNKLPIPSQKTQKIFSPPWTQPWKSLQNPPFPPLIGARKTRTLENLQFTSSLASRLTTTMAGRFPVSIFFLPAVRTLSPAFSQRSPRWSPQRQPHSVWLLSGARNHS